MASIQEQYTRELLENLQYFGTWLPLVQLEVGAVGVIRSHAFQQMTSLEELGVPFQLSPGRASGTFKHVSEEGVEVSFKLAGELPLAGSKLAQADAGATVDFSRSGGIYFEADGCVMQSLKNPATLERSLLDLYASRAWKKDYFVVTEVMRAKSTTILISRSNSARVELRAVGKLDTNLGSLASAEARFKVAVQRNLTTEIVAQRELTPLFKAACLRFPLFQAPRLESRGLGGKPGARKKATAPPRLSTMGLKDLWPRG